MKEKAVREGEYWAYGALAILVAAVISCFSGYRSVPLSGDVTWQFSPLGLLEGISPETFELRSFSAFAGRFELTFDYFKVFGLTCLLELPFYFAIFRKKGLLFVLFALASANILTHPIVFFVFPRLFENYLTSLFGAEIFAPLAESIYVMWLMTKVNAHQPLAWGAVLVILANLFSWQVGVML